MVLVLAVAAAVERLPIGNQSVSEPSAYTLRLYPNNATAMQAQNITIKLEAALLEGQSAPITLSANGGPNGIIYRFSNQTVTLTQTRLFRSNLTIFVPPLTASGSYLIDVVSNASTQTSHAPFNLAVLNAEIQVSGNVTIDSKVNLSGVTLDVIPTDIVFTSNSTGETYHAKIHRFTDTDLAPGRTGNYSIELPNQQNYHVEFLCFTFEHFIPVARVATNVDHGHYTVSCGIGVNSTVTNFVG